MKKRWLSILITLVLALCLYTNANADMKSTNIVLSLTFSGTKANCEASITDYGKTINATLQLWQGNTLVKSWYGVGTSNVVIRGTRYVTSGQSYTLKVTGYVNGVPIPVKSVTKACP